VEVLSEFVRNLRDRELARKIVFNPQSLEQEENWRKKDASKSAP
jgi:hypothetical protein